MECAAFLQVALFQLSDVTLILSVFNKRALQRRELIGWISLGLNSSGEEELAHWTHMKECKGQQVCKGQGTVVEFRSINNHEKMRRQDNYIRWWCGQVYIT